MLRWLSTLLCLVLLAGRASAAGNEPSNTLPAANASFQSQLQQFLRQEDPARETEVRGGGSFVHSGGLHSTAASCTASAISLDAFTSASNHITANGAGGTVAINYNAANIAANCANPGSDVCWLVGSAQGQDFTAAGARTVVSMPTLPGSAFNRVGTSNVYVDCTSSTQPALPADSVYLAKVTITNAAVTAVTDLRKPASYVRHNVFDLTDPLYGGACDGLSADTLGGSGTDNTPAWNLAVGALKTTGGILFIPHGFCHFASQPAPLQHGVTVRGEGLDVTYLVRDYTEADVSQGFLDMDMANTGNIDNAGGGVEQLSLWAKSGTTGGSAIDMDSVASAAQGRITIDRIRISGSGTWNYGIRGDGSLSTGAAPGIRGIVIRHAYVFQAATINVLMLAINHFMLDQAFLADSAATANLVVDGGTGGGAVQSNDITIVCEFCPSVKLGVGVATDGVHFSTTQTTTLTVGTFLTGYTIAGSIGTITGTATPGSPTTYSFLGGGKIGAGLGSFTASGAKFETADGLTFPAVQVPSSNANTLDDYREGTCTPTVEGTTGAGTANYAAQYCFYIKIGRVVQYWINVGWNTHTGTGNLRIAGLPHAVTNETGYFAAAAVYYSNLAVGAGLQLVCNVQPNATTILCYGADPAGGAVAAVPIDVSATLVLSGAYRSAN